jgi:hypothetical protein
MLRAVVLPRHLMPQLRQSGQPRRAQHLLDKASRVRGPTQGTGDPRPNDHATSEHASGVELLYADWVGMDGVSTPPDPTAA